MYTFNVHLDTINSDICLTIDECIVFIMDISIMHFTVKQ